MKSKDRRPALLSLALLAAAAACGGASKPTPSAPANVTPSAEPPAPIAVESTARTAASEPAADTARGGRLFDKWFKEAKSKFKPDAKATIGVADGQGGPRDNGTLLLADGTPLLNDTGHDYRLKSFFGWDLRGVAGVYGPAHMNKSTALGVDLLSWTGSRAEIADRLARGEAGLPALGTVLERPDLESLAAFVVATRDGALPRADEIVILTSAASEHYALRPAGNPERGKKLFADRCAKCHGADGTAFLLDEGEFSLGSHARQKAYEDWFKILNGQPGTPMGRQVKGTTATEMGQEILDLLSALCDRRSFPVGKAKGKDVPNGDPRCGLALR